MATMITEACINCGICEEQCPNRAISGGGTTFEIDPKRCTECVGFYASEQCAAVCPVDCCIPDPDLVETEPVLFERAKDIHPDEAVSLRLSAETSHFRREPGRARIERCGVPSPDSRSPGPAPAYNRTMRRGPADLVDVVRDFITVHQRMQRLFEQFRDGNGQFEDARGLVADSESSVLFRLKERVHASFRTEDLTSPLKRGGVLFDLAIGSLFHEALKFRENLYQLEVYQPKVLLLRREVDGEADELLTEFERILAGAAERLRESLSEAETLLEQTRRLFVTLLADRRHEVGIGLVARFLIENRDAVESVYPEGVDDLLGRVHGSVSEGYGCAIRSLLDSARFREAAELVALATSKARGTDARAGFAQLRRYATGMQAFLDGEYAASLDALADWIDSGTRAPEDVELARVALRRIPELLEGETELKAEAARLASVLEEGPAAAAG